jgi:hypothetical protein
VHQPRPEALEQLALAEHDRRLVLDAPRDVAAAGYGLGLSGEPDQQSDSAAEQRAADPQSDCQRDRGERRGYVPFAFRISALIAGRISCRSPITA